MKKKFTTDLAVGEMVKEEAFMLKELSGKDRVNTAFILTDSKGRMPASIPNEIADEVKLEELVGTVVDVEGIVIPDGMVPILRVKSLKVSTDFVPVEVTGGLSGDKVKAYITDIGYIKSVIKTEGLRALLDACLTEENLKKLSELPATLGLYGKYPGGALAATSSVSRMVISSTQSYVKMGNGFSTGNPNWNVLVAASLLFMYGTITYFEKKDGKTVKSRKGMTVGYYACLQEALDIQRSKLNIEENDYALLLNILQVSVSDRTEVSAISKDGIVLRNIIKMYGEMDSLDWEIATHQDEEKELFYNPKMKRFILKEN